MRADFEQLIRQGRSALDERAFGAAETSFRQALAAAATADERRTATLSWFEVDWMRPTGDPTQTLASDVLASLTTHGPEDPRERWLEAHARALQGQPEAEDALREALTLPAGQAPAALHLVALNRVRERAEADFDPATELACLEAMLVVARHEGRDAVILEVAEHLAGHHYLHGDTESAEAVDLLVLSTAKLLGPDTMAAALERVARRRARSGNLRGAETAYEQLRTTHEQRGDVEGYLHSALRLGDVAARQHAYAAAHEVYDQGRAMAILLVRPVEELIFIRRLLHLAELREDPTLARQLATEADRKAQALEPEHPAVAAETYLILARSSRLSGSHERGFARLRSALAAAESARDIHLAHLAAMQLGEPHPVELVRRLQQPPVEAGTLLARARRMETQPGDPGLVLTCIQSARRMLLAENAPTREDIREACDEMERMVYRLPLRDADRILDPQGAR